MVRILFFHMVLRKFMENTKNKPTFSQYNIFHKCKCLFFQSVFQSFYQSPPRKSIKSGTKQSVLQLALFSCLAVHSLWAVAMLFNIFPQINKKWKFYGPYFQTMLFLVTMVFSSQETQRKHIQTEVYSKSIQSVRKEATHKLSKVQQLRKSFSPVRMSLAQLASISFLFLVITETQLFFTNVYPHPEVLFNLYVLAFFETSDLKKTLILFLSPQ